MRVTLMLADSAQAVNGKLYILGGGWSITGPMPSPSAIAIKIEVPWNEANRRHTLKLELMDEDRNPVSVPTPAGNSPLVISGDFEVGRPAGLIQGSPIDTAFAFNIGPIPLAPAKRYYWHLTINGNAQNDWRLGFATRPQAQTANVPPQAPPT